MRLRVVLWPALALAVAGLLLLLQGAGGGDGPAPPPAGGAGKGGPAAPPGPAAGKWHPEPVRKATIPKTERFPCVVRAPRPVVLRSPLRGTPVEEVLRREGEAVREGDVLVRLNGASWERELAEARKAGDAAREAKAKEALASLEVRAPEAGIVWRMHARRGDMPLTYRGEPLPLVELFDWTRLRFEGTAPAALAEILDGGAPVLVRHGKDVLTAARVASRGAPGPDGSFAVVAVPTAPPGEAPEPDGPGEVHVATGVEEALAVPAAAVKTADGRPCVHVVTVTGELVRTPVVLGLPLPDRRIAISGVDPLASVAVWE